MPTQPGTHPLDRLQPRKSVRLPSQAQGAEDAFPRDIGPDDDAHRPAPPLEVERRRHARLASEQESRPAHAGVSRSSNAHSRTCVALTSASTADGIDFDCAGARDPFAP